MPLYSFLEQCVLQHEKRYCSDAELQKAIDYVATHAGQKSINVTEKRNIQLYSEQQSQLLKNTKVGYFYSVLYGVSIAWFILGIIVLFQSEEFLKYAGSRANSVLYFMFLFWLPGCIVHWLRNKYLNKRLR